jgi:hypothetical protein
MFLVESLNEGTAEMGRGRGEPQRGRDVIEGVMSLDSRVEDLVYLRSKPKEWLKMAIILGYGGRKWNLT